LLMAAACGAFYWHLAGRVARVEAWPTTDAVVVVNETRIVQGPRLNTSYPLLTLEYTYDVAGRRYTGKNVNVDGTAVKFDEKAYPVGSRMPVRYDPADPSIAGANLPLVPEMKGYGLIYLGAALTAVGLFLLFFAEWSWLRQRAALSL
jgi:hypothetical protein